MKSYPTHPFAEIFPLADGPQMWDLREDIKANGLREAIWLWNGYVVDGRRRQVCCLALGVEPRYREFVGTHEEVLKFVISMNLHRRHLSDTERAIVAAKIAALPRGSNQYLGKGSNSPDGGPSPEKVISRSEAAEVMNVSERAVDRAKKVLTQGTPELQAAVNDETLSLSAAADIASAPPMEQKKIVKDTRAGKPKAPKYFEPGVFDWSRIEKPLGQLLRAIDEAGNAYGKRNYHTLAMDIMKKAADALKLWKENVVMRTKQ
jgi:hypothetical protein